MVRLSVDSRVVASIVASVVASVVASSCACACGFPNPHYGESAGSASATTSTSEGTSATLVTTTATSTTADPTTATSGTATAGESTSSSGTTEATTTADASTTDDTTTGGPGLTCAEATEGDTILWARRIGGGGVQRAAEVAIAGDGGVIVVGRFSKEVVVGALTGIADADDLELFVVKLAADGAPIWLRTFGGLGNDFATAVAIEPGGELVIAGRFAGELGLVDPPLTSLGNDDAFLARLDPQGEVLWARSFGGKGDDLLHDLAVTDDGGVIGVGALGPSTLPIDLAPGLQVSTVSTAALLARFSTADGEGIWAMEALTNDPAGESIAANVALGKNGSIYVSGTFGPNDLDFGGKKITTKGTGGDFWLGRVDDETAKWVVGFGDDLIQSGRNIAYDQDLDRLHASLRFLGAPGLKGLSADDETPDVGVVGLKASDGVPNWSVQIFGEGDATAEGLDLDELGRIRFVADISDGAKVGDLDFPAAGGDFLTLTLAGDGAVLGARHFTGPSEQESEDIAAVPGGCAVVVGSFNGDLVEGPTTLLSAAADQDAFVLLLPP